MLLKIFLLESKKRQNTSDVFCHSASVVSVCSKDTFHKSPCLQLHGFSYIALLRSSLQSACVVCGKLMFSVVSVYHCGRWGVGMWQLPMMPSLSHRSCGWPSPCSNLFTWRPPPPRDLFKLIHLGTPPPLPLQTSIGKRAVDLPKGLLEYIMAWMMEIIKCFQCYGLYAWKYVHHAQIVIQHTS